MPSSSLARRISARFSAVMGIWDTSTAEKPIVVQAPQDLVRAGRPATWFFSIISWTPILGMLTPSFGGAIRPCGRG